MSQNKKPNQIKNYTLIKDNTSIKPPVGLIPKEIFEENKRIDRFNDVCRAISRYYNAGLKINPSWINEYNDLVSEIKK